MLLREMVEKNRVCFHEGFDSWEEAIVAACQPLLNDKSIEPAYVDSIIDCVRQYGPYIVFAPNIAMPHSQHGAEGVNDTAVAFMRLKRPVHFEEGNPEKDARLFFTVCAVDKDVHLQNIERLAELLISAPSMTEDLLAAESPEDLLAIDGRIT